MRSLTRRHFAILPAAALAAETASSAFPAFAQFSFAQSSASLITRPIPATGEPVPAVGLGTASVFDTADATTRQKARAVVQALIDNGGKLIDTASTYGDA
ncbi:MAG: aldo/keto reductase, partial [Xanthobacteraceae bacterium]